MERSRSLQLLAVMQALTVVSACAARPKLYPNAAFVSRGQAGTEADIDSSMKDADAYLASSKGKKVARSADFGAIVDGVVGAVSGLFSGNVGRNAAEGAAMGGVGGTAGALIPDEIKRSFVDKCLADKGYQVLGWD